MRATCQKPVTAGSRRCRRLAAGALVVLAAGPLLAGCGKSSVGAETSSVRDEVEHRIKASAERNHLALNEVSCLEITTTKVTCFAHVKTSRRRRNDGHGNRELRQPHARLQARRARAAHREDLRAALRGASAARGGSADGLAASCGARQPARARRAKPGPRRSPTGVAAFASRAAALASPGGGFCQPGPAALAHWGRGVRQPGPRSLARAGAS